MVPRWTGAAVYRSGSATYYEAVKLDSSTVVRVGSFVSVLLAGASPRGMKKAKLRESSEYHGVGVVEALWQEKGGGKMAEVRWFVSPREARLAAAAAAARAGVDDRHELFETDDVDECPVEAIESDVAVFPKNVLMEMLRQRRDGSDSSGDEAEDGEVLGKEFFCEWFLHKELGVLRPSHLLSRERRKYIYSKRLRDVDFAGDSNELLVQPGQEADPFGTALRLLQLSAIPPSLPCREAEREQVLNFVRGSLKGGGGGGGALYISGMPGTGKTATVKEVVRSLRADAELGKIDAFDFVEVNAMALRHPYDCYSAIYRGLTGIEAGHQRAGQALEQMFSGTPESPNKRKCVLLVDELDYMVTKKQTVLYNLFDWPARPNSWLVCIGIANTMDLPERLLPRIHSRMGMTRVVFNTYTYQQLEKIVCARLRGLEVFDSGAVQFCAKKVASVSGDIRRALQICRKAVAVCQAEGAKAVGIEHVQRASSELQNSATKRALRSLPLLEKLVCVALYKRLNVQASEEVAFEDVFRQVVLLWKDYGASSGHPSLFHHLSKPQVLAPCRRLGASHLLGLSEGDHDRSPTLALGPEIAIYDVKDALAQDEICSVWLS